MQDFDRAIEDLTTAIRFDPQAASSFNTRGYCYARKGQYGRAFADGKEGLKLDPKTPVIYLDASRERLKRLR